MKILIWFLCLLVYAIITTTFQWNGIYLGAIPTMILFGVALILARSLCKAYDKHKNEKNQDK